MKRLLMIACMTMLLASAVFAEDVATLVNLGFSSDSAFFMFGYHGLDIAAGKPYAELYVVDTKKNDFVKDGIFKGLYSVQLEPGWDTSGAFFKLYSTAGSATAKYKIDHLQQGRLVYLSINGEGDPNELSFRELSTGEQWEIRLVQKSEEKDGTVLSSFGIDLAITDAKGKKTAVKVGNPQIRRTGVLSYAIRRVLVAPDGKTVVFIIERTQKAGGGAGIRYMVETIRLP